VRSVFTRKLDVRRGPEETNEEIRDLPSEEELTVPALGPPLLLTNLPKQTVQFLDLDLQVTDDPSET
jgi:hypothetical protein